MDITVIVPVFKGQRFIAPIQRMILENVEYLKAQGHPLRIELLFVNDYPKEDIIIEPMTESFDVILITNEANSGIHQTRVNGLKNAKGEFVLFLDQDDEIAQNCLYSQYLAVGNNDIVVGNGYRGINGKYRKIYRDIKKQQLACKEKFFLKAANQIVSPGHCLIRKSAIPLAWYTNIMKVNGCDDLYLWLLMFENDKKFCINHDCIYKHVDTGVNLSSDLNAMYMSADNLIKIAEESKTLNVKSIAIYKRRISYLKSMQTKSIARKVIACIKNMDICLSKLYAYYI